MLYWLATKLIISWSDLFVSKRCLFMSQCVPSRSVLFVSSSPHPFVQKRIIIMKRDPFLINRTVVFHNYGLSHKFTGRLFWILRFGRSLRLLKALQPRQPAMTWQKDTYLTTCLHSFFINITRNSKNIVETRLDENPKLAIVIKLFTCFFLSFQSGI